MQQSKEFQHYISLCDDRSLLKVARHFGVSKTAIAKRSKREEWQRKLKTAAIQKQLLNSRRPPNINLSIVDRGFFSIEELSDDEDAVTRETWLPDRNNEINLEFHLRTLIARTKDGRLEIEKRIAHGETLQAILNPPRIRNYNEEPNRTDEDDEPVFIIPREPYSPLRQEKENRKALEFDPKVGEEMNTLAVKKSYRTIKIHRI